MGLIQTVRGFTPSFGKECYVAPNATVVGNVIFGDECSVWFNAVVRGDVHSIRAGNRVNIQDGAILHCTYEKYCLTIGNNVSIGHNAVVHGATIHDNVLVGIGAIILDGAVIGENSIIAAGALVLEGTIVEPGSIYGGLPAKFIKKIDMDKGIEMIQRIAGNYPMYASWFKEE